MQIETIETAEALPAFAEFSFDPAAFEAAAAFLAKRLVEPRNTIPILSHLRIEASPAGSVTITGTDLDNWAAVTIAANVTSPGAVCIDAGPLADALAKLRKGKVQIATLTQDSATAATVKGGRSRFALKALPTDDFPLPPTDELADAAPLSRFTVPAARFLADLAALAPCQSTEATRYYLNGMALQVRNLGGRDRFVMAATDGHCMAVSSRPLPAGAETLPDLILCRKAVALATRAAKLAGPINAAAIEYDPAGRGAGVIRLALGPVAITTKAIDGTYPQWERAFETALAPTDGPAALFPELLPGAPAAQLEKLTKAAGGDVTWEPARDGLTGTVPGDDGLILGAMAMRGDTSDKKGMAYQWRGQDEAQAYLLALAESRGLPSPEELAARAEAIQESFGEYDLDAMNGRRPFGRVSNHGVRLIQRGGRVIGLTVAGEVRIGAWRETVQDWEALCEREIHHAPTVEAIEGSYSVVMPPERAALEPESYIEGPDGVTYPVAMGDKAIAFSKDQVRALIGESCFATMEITLPNGKAAHILRWLWDQGDSRFLTVRQDGRTFSGGVYVTRAEIEAGPVLETPEAAMPESPALEPAEICPQGPQESEGEACPVAECQSEPEALSEALSAAAEPVSVAYELPEPAAVAIYGKLAALIERAEAVAERLANPLPAENAHEGEAAEACAIAESPTVAKRTAAHERAIRRAWAERARARKYRSMHDRDLRQVYAERDAERAIAAKDFQDAQEAAEQETARLRSELNKALGSADRMAEQAKAYRYERDTLEGALQRVQAKRRRSVELARSRGRDMAAMAAMMHEQQARLEAAEKIQPVIWQSGTDRHTQEDHAFRAIERLDAVQCRLSEAEAARDRLQEQVEKLADAMCAENIRALRAETALKAVQARANGHPPAVQSVKVRFAA